MRRGPADLFATSGQAAQNFECQTITTPETAGQAGEHSAYYLDRQKHITCGDKGVLRGWQFMRGASGATMYYKLTCCKGSWADSTVTTTTSTPYSDGSETIYLDRRKVECPADQALVGWLYERGSAPVSDSLYRYNVTCTNAKMYNCSERKTLHQLTGVNRKNEIDIIYLDRFRDIMCPADHIMTGWWIRFLGGTEFRMWEVVYNCCNAMLGE